MQNIDVTELKSRMDAGEQLHILDVRETWEFDEYNIGGKLIPLGELPGRLEEIEDWKTTEVIVHCRSGARSASALAFLTSQGFENVRNLLGGVLDWQRNFG
jgi:rhodanese-related sulfurtransferase